MQEILIKTLQVILCFSILIVLHEGGHYFFARLFKVRVEKFLLFFDPWFTPIKWKPKWSETTFGIGWLPLGGYVKISGMIDESLDREQLHQPMQPWEFRSKPAWQRLLIMLGGVLVNLILPVIIYAMLLFINGEQYTPLQRMTHGMSFTTEAQRLGFRDGDILLTADGDTLKRFDSNMAIADVYRAISQAHEVRVERQGKEVAIPLPGDLDLIHMMKSGFLSPLIPGVIDSVVPQSRAETIGLRAGDELIALNGQRISTWNDYDRILRDIQQKVKATPQDSVHLQQLSLVVNHSVIERFDTLHIALTNDLRIEGMIPARPIYEKDSVTYTFFASLPAGAVYGWNVMAGYVDDLRYLFTSEGVKNVGSFITIGNLFPSSFDWTRFWSLTAFISIMLAFMNILPIPALDGGHVLFLLYEVITRRKPSDKFLEYAQTLGMILLLGLMLLALFNDTIKYIVSLF